MCKYMSGNRLGKSWRNMTQSDINKGNILIAKFLDWEEIPYDKGEDRDLDFKYLSPEGLGIHYIQELRFHESWSWLMKAIDLIEAHPQRDYIEDPVLYYGKYKGGWYAGFKQNWAGDNEIYYGVEAEHCNSKLEACYQAVISTIKWLNEKHR